MSNHVTGTAAAELGCSLDALYDVLSHAHRRYALSRLSELTEPISAIELAREIAAWESEPADDAVAPETRPRRARPLPPPEDGRREPDRLRRGPGDGRDRRVGVGRRLDRPTHGRLRLMEPFSDTASTRIRQPEASTIPVATGRYDHGDSR